MTATTRLDSEIRRYSVLCLFSDRIEFNTVHDLHVLYRPYVFMALRYVLVSSVFVWHCWLFGANEMFVVRTCKVKYDAIWLCYAIIIICATKDSATIILCTNSPRLRSKSFVYIIYTMLICTPWHMHTSRTHVSSCR